MLRSFFAYRHESIIIMFFWLLFLGVIYLILKKKNFYIDGLKSGVVFFFCFVTFLVFYSIPYFLIKNDFDDCRRNISIVLNENQKLNVLTHLWNEESMIFNCSYQYEKKMEYWYPFYKILKL